VTLGRVIVAWIVVAAWFGIATVVMVSAMVRLTRSQDAVAYIGVLPQALKRRVAEALFITLIASLWFDSLGSGQWWLLFGLVGVLVSSSVWFLPAPDAVTKRVLIADIVFDLARYVGAGALLAWRLS
jgi:hypothetical protein